VWHWDHSDLISKPHENILKRPDIINARAN